MNSAGVLSAAIASDGAAAPAITPMATVRALTNGGEVVPATRLAARACHVAGDDLVWPSSRRIRSELVFVRLPLMPFSPENSGIAVELFKAAWGHMGECRCPPL